MQRSVLAASLLAALSACQVGSFHTVVSGVATVPGSPLGQVLSSLPAFANFTSIDFDQDQDFKSRGVSKDMVTSVKADSVKVTIQSPDDQDFSFLDTLQFDVKADSNEATVAHREDISQLGLAAPNPTLTMDLDGTELQPYVTAPEMSLVVSGSGRPPPEDTKLEADVGLEVQYKL